MNKTNDPPVLTFSSTDQWESWLGSHYGHEEGIWLRFFKKHSGRESVSHAEALEIALCYGWIDGQGKTFDDESWLVRFTPRRPKSIWSKRNREKAEWLISRNKMKTSGLVEIEKAKADGRWEAAYDSPKNMEVPEDFLKELKKDKKAYAFFKTLNKSNTYPIAWRLQTAKKPETRQKRMEKILEMMRNGEKFH